MDYDDLLGQWARLIRDFPDQQGDRRAEFRHLLIDEMQDTNTRPGRAGRDARPRGGGEPDGGRRRRPVDLRVPRGELRQHPQVRRTEPGGRGSSSWRSTIGRRPRSSPSRTPRSPATRPASARRSSRPGPRARARWSSPRPTRTRRPSSSASRSSSGTSRGSAWGRWPSSIGTTTTASLLQAELVTRGIPYTVRSGLRFFEQAHVKDVLAFLRVIVNAPRRGRLATPAAAPARGSARPSPAAIFDRLAASADPLAAARDGRDDEAASRPRAKGHFAGFVADLRKIQATDPEADPAAAIGAILAGGYPATVKVQVRAAREPRSPTSSSSPSSPPATTASNASSPTCSWPATSTAPTPCTTEEPTSTSSSARSTRPRAWNGPASSCSALVEDGFPNARALNEPGGEDEERRIFYVAVTRAKDELFLTYPTISRGCWAPTVVAKPSRFLTEVDPGLVEPVSLESDADLTWSGGERP